MDETPRPRYSLILSAYESHGTLRRTLESLRRQTCRDFETIVVDSSPGEEALTVTRDFPEVSLVRPGRRMNVHQARNAGVAQARADRLVFTDPDCVAAPEWLARIDGCFRAGRRFVGGPIACWPGGVREEAVYLAKFWRWLPGGGSRHYSDLPTASLAVERALYDAVGGIPEVHVSGDTEFCLRVGALTGIEPWLDDAAVTQHMNEGTTRSMFRERYVRGRAFGAMRAAEPGWGALQSLALVLGWPVLAARHVWVKFRVCAARGHLPLFFRTLPFVTGLDAAWMLGQARSGITDLRARLKGAAPVERATP